MRPRVLDETGRRVDAVHVRWRAFGEDRLRKRAGATADVEPARARGYAEPGEEFLRHHAAPAPDVRLVPLARDPDVFLHCAALAPAMRPKTDPLVKPAPPG